MSSVAPAGLVVPVHDHAVEWIEISKHKTINPTTGKNVGQPRNYALEVADKNRHQKIREWKDGRFEVIDCYFDDMCVFAKQMARQGTDKEHCYRTYVACTFGQFYVRFARMPLADRCWEEVIPSGRPCKLHIDFEILLVDNPEVNGDKTLRRVLCAIDTELRAQFGFGLAECDVVIKDASNDRKVSRHIVIDLLRGKAAFVDQLACGAFVDEVARKLLLEDYEYLQRQHKETPDQIKLREDSVAVRDIKKRTRIPAANTIYSEINSSAIDTTVYTTGHVLRAMYCIKMAEPTRMFLPMSYDDVMALKPFVRPSPRDVQPDRIAMYRSLVSVWPIEREQAIRAGTEPARQLLGTSQPRPPVRPVSMAGAYSMSKQQHQHVGSGAGANASVGGAQKRKRITITDGGDADDTASASNAPRPTWERRAAHEETLMAREVPDIYDLRMPYTPELLTKLAAAEEFEHNRPYKVHVFKRSRRIMLMCEGFMCSIKGAPHSHNHVFYVISANSCAYQQRCYSPHCQAAHETGGRRLPWTPLSADAHETLVTFCRDGGGMALGSTALAPGSTGGAQPVLASLLFGAPHSEPSL